MPGKKDILKSFDPIPTKAKLGPGPGKILGNLEDHTIRKSVKTKDGSVTRSPIADIDIVNLGFIKAGGAGDIWVEKAGDTMTGDLIMSDNIFITTGTSDGSDNESTGITGGGSLSNLRGSFVRVSGNEDGNTGKLFLTAGNVTGGTIRMSTGGASRLEIDKDGTVGIGTTSPKKDLHIESAVPTIRLSDDNATTDQQVATLVEFFRANDTNRVGFLGMASSGNDEMRLATDYAAGQVVLASGSNATALVIDSSQNFDFQSGNLETGGNVTIGNKLIHDGDADTFIAFTPDKISFQAGGQEFMVYIEQAISTYQFKMEGVNQMEFIEASLNPAITIFNTDGGDIDFKIQGDSDTNLFFIDASRDNIGIGTSSVDVSAKLEISSTTGALLLPRMTTTQRDALTAVNGMLVYNSTNNVLEAYENGSWIDI